MVAPVGILTHRRDLPLDQGIEWLQQGFVGTRRLQFVERRGDCLDGRQRASPGALRER